MLIHYTQDVAFGEQGPNFLWFGTLQEIQQMTESRNPLVLYPDDKLTMIGCSSVILRVTISGQILVGDDGNGAIECDLSEDLWSEVIEKFASIDSPGGFQYIEFDDRPDLREDANWVVESRSDVNWLIEHLRSQQN